MKIEDHDIQELATEFNINPAAIKAVMLVESPGAGFYPEFLLDKKGKPKLDINGKEIPHPHANELLIRFEGHYFRKYTKGKYDLKYPKLSYKDWKLGYKYNRGINEFGRFIEAFNLDKEAAWLSCSWGMFQIMGANFRECGYATIKDMLLDFYKGEKNQLRAFLNFCDSKNILDDIRRQDWVGFARVYNGPNYMKNQYPEKLKNYFSIWNTRI